MPNEKPPLVVGLEGTLIRTDLLIECLFVLASQSPFQLAKALRHSPNGQAGLKNFVVRNVALDIHDLPFNEELVEWLKAEKAAGRKIYLVSSSHALHVEAIAKHTGFFEGICASEDAMTLSNEAKAAKLSALFGEGGFDYVGNSRADLPIWDAAAGVILTNASPSVASAVRKKFPAVTEIGSRGGHLKEWLHVLRIHQWLKNLLIFVPALAAHHFDSVTALHVGLAFLSFSLCASSAYILNDLLDLRSDRAHPTKRLRPFAAGRVDIRHGVIALPITLIAALAIALLLPFAFLLVLVGYYALTLSYSGWIKRKALLDVVALACLYGIRLVAGGTAAGVALSPWLLIFAVFLFFCLALVKRCAELAERIRKGMGNPAGRGYRLEDLPILEVLAGATGCVSVMIFGLYINSESATGLYSHPQRLWPVLVILLYWISRVLLLTHRGEMDEDPVLFAARDRTSILCAGLIFAIMLSGI